MPEPTDAALTPEQWAALRLQDEGGAVHIDGDAVEAEGRFAGDERRALAALALHQQPFGFSWKDVDLIRSTVLADDIHSHDEWWALQRLGDRIAALLPPRQGRPHSGEE